MQIPKKSLSEHTNLKSATLDNLSGFDTECPPNQKLLDICIHCGFCLPGCPSYQVTGKEMESPRGRIYLMKAISEGEISLNNSSVKYFDSCLGCFACTTNCPPGVQYDKLISATRSQIERNYQRSFSDRLYRKLIFSLFPYPRRLKILLVPLLLYQKLGLQKLIRTTNILNHVSPHLAEMESILPKISPCAFQDNLPEVIPSQGKKRYRVGMILGCVQRLFFSSVNLATLNVLTANGCEVVIPRNQGCCGALLYHQGQTQQTKVIARQMIDSFENTDVDAIIIASAGCGHTLKEYDQILEEDVEYSEKAKVFTGKVKDLQEFLVTVGLTAKLLPLEAKTLNLVYQDACHLLHGQRISLQPRQLLEQIPGVNLKEPIDAAMCCGSAGVYNLLQPKIANELGQQKVQNLLSRNADLIISSNPGCILQIRKYLRLQGKNRIPVMHIMELLDHSIQGKAIPF